MPSILYADERKSVAVAEQPSLSHEPPAAPQQTLPAPKTMSAAEGALSAITAIIAVAAISYSAGLLSDPTGARVHLSVDSLHGGLFHNFLIPGILLLVFVGGSTAVASGLVLAAHRWARPAALVAGSIVVTWVAVRVAIMGFGSFMEPLAFAAGVAIVILAVRLPRADA